MNTIHRLKRDHKFFSTRLAELEPWLDLSPPWATVLGVTEMLARQLADHIDRECALFTEHCPVITPNDLGRALAGHREALGSLEAISQFLREHPRCVAEQVQPNWMAMVRQLRRGIEYQETSLFPCVANGLALLALRRRTTASGSLGLTGTMTIREALEDYPAIREVLERLLDENLCEASASLGELAWRRGMGAEALLADLQTIACAEGLLKLRGAPVLSG